MLAESPHRTPLHFFFSSLFSIIDIYIYKLIYKQIFSFFLNIRINLVRLAAVCGPLINDLIILMKVGHLNVRSLPAHFPEVQNLILGEDCDVFAVSETWVYAECDVSAYTVDDYDFVFVGRTRAGDNVNLGRGGGVGLYIKSKFKYNVLLQEVNNLFEHLWIEVTNICSPLTVGVLYRPNGSIGEFLNGFEETLSLLMPRSEGFLCLGDFNINGFDINGTYGKKFIPTIEQFGLKQIINAATRITSTTATLIDYIITGIDALVEVSDVVAVHNISDHSMVFVTLQSETPVLQPKTITFRDFKYFILDDFLNDLNAIPWHIMLQLHSMDEKLAFFNFQLNEIFNFHAPIRKIILRKNYRPWVTDNIKILMRLRDRAYKKFKLTKDAGHFSEYKELRNFTNRAIQREKKAFLDSMLSDRDYRSLWGAFRRLGIAGGKPQAIPETVSDPDSINNFFLSSQNHGGGDGDLIFFYNSHRLPVVTEEFVFALTSEDEIVRTLHGIKTDAVGSDGITRKMLLLCCPVIVPYLCHLINYGLENSVFPSEWKNARVVPVPKVRSPLQLKDLRPISILPVLSKVFERIVADQLWGHLNRFAILPEKQSGFRAGFSCTSALLDVTDDIIRDIDKKLVSALVLLDFSKAFDRLHHATLLSLLHYIGLSRPAVDLFESYLSERFQRVCLAGSSSSLAPVVSGVPQGSILGPILYLIYTFDLCRPLRYCRYHMYADDTQLYYSFRSDDCLSAQDHINEDIVCLLEHATKHCLTVNASKSSVVVFGSEPAASFVRDSLRVTVNDSVLEVASEARSLGVILDSELRFRKHINSLLARAYSTLKLLYTNRLLLNKKLKTQLCDTLVLSIFNYGDVLYGPCLDSVYVTKIQRVQNACLRFVHGIRKRERISHTLGWVGWLNMSRRRALHSACLYHKIILHKSPPYLFRKISFRTDVHNINIRHRNTITIPLHRMTLFKRSFSYSLPYFYNDIDYSIKLEGERGFKINFRRELFRRQQADV